jgi:hypothetical protein
MDPGEARHLHNYPADAGRAVDDAVSSRHPALGQRLDPGRQFAKPVVRKIIAAFSPLCAATTLSW